MQFLSPIWLTAMAGIVIPIAIHLWNVRQGKVLEVGTIRFMEQSQKKRASNVRISEWLLLLLRCLTIIVFAIVMAGPVWKKSADAGEKGWLLIAPNELKEAYHQKSSIIDSLLKNGYQLRAFETSFSAINLSDSVTRNSDSSLLATTPNYWTLASKLIATAPLGIDLAIISSNQIRHFKGDKPSINRSVHWMVFMDTVARKNNQAAIVVDTATLRIALFADQYLHDASYVSTAIQAIRDFTGRKIRFEVYKSVNAIPQNFDVLFWLSDTPLPTGFSGKIISYQKGMLRQEPGFVYGIQGGVDNKTELYQYLETDQKNLLKTWENGKGDPILAVDPNAEKHYLLFTHFDPSWNNLVWSNRFAEWMLTFVLDGSTMQDVRDNRTIDPGQLDFSKDHKSASKKITNPANEQPIGNIFWFLLMLVFIIERILSFTSKNKANV
ncbi:MAG: BatA domain-containing protein [Bacteroidetes bacterium]|nr:BatA domain-containing protein [Bacteroidota bacterium]